MADCKQLEACKVAHESVGDDSDAVDGSQSDAELLSERGVPKQERVCLCDHPGVERDQLLHAEPAEVGGPLEQPDDRQVEQVEETARNHQLKTTLGRKNASHYGTLRLIVTPGGTEYNYRLRSKEQKESNKS